MLDDLAAQGYLSDERYAHALVRQKTGGYSKRAIAQTLKAKGVTGEVVTVALDAADADGRHDDGCVMATPLWAHRRRTTASGRARSGFCRAAGSPCRQFSNSCAIRPTRATPTPA